MSVWKPLAHPPLALLWASQTLSAVGDEFYAVALVWMAVGLIGHDAAYLTAVQAATMLAVSLFGGVLAERWDLRRTMIGADLARAAVVLAVPVAVWAGGASLPLLLGTVIAVSALSALFDPALQASVPRLVTDPALRQATNGLLDTTRRAARIVGPGLIGLAGAALPVEHFFTIDAATFLASAVALLLLRRALPYQVPAVPPHWREALTGGLRLVRRHALARYAILSSAVCNGTWYLGFILGMALLVQERWPGDLQAYGFVIAAYGCGNLAANLVVASVPIRRPAVRLLASRLFYGLGVAALALPLPLPATCAIAAVAAIGGPLGDMTILHILQTDFPPGDLARLYRLRMAAVQGATLLALLAAPWLYGAIGVAAAVCLSGLAAAAAGLGAVRFIVNRGQLCIHSKA